MNEATIVRVERSFQMLLAPYAEALADRFFVTLFAENPGLRPLFPANMTEQKRNLIATLAEMVEKLRSGRELKGPLVDSGPFPWCTGMSPDGHAIVRDTLIEVMGELAGGAWSHELDRAWREALDFLAAAARQARRPEESVPAKP